MIGTEAEDAFVSEHRWAVLTTLRKSGAASSSLVAYGRHGDDLLVSTRSIFGKVKMLERDARITLCIISNEEPFNFVTVEGRAGIERDLAAILGPTRQVFAALKAINYPEPDDLPKWLESQGRVILRVRAEKVYGVQR